MNKLITFLIAIGLSILSASATINPFGGVARDGAVSFVIENTVYVGLGNNASGALKDFWKYSKSSNTWEQIADFNGNARFGATAFTLNGKGYVGLGRDGYGGNLFKDFYEYDPAINQWTKCANDFGGAARHSAVSFVINGVAYVGTGEDGTDATSDFWSFDGINWTQLSSTFSGDKRRAATAFVIDGKAYVTGGSYFGSYSVQLSDVQEYNPTTDTWTEKIFAAGTDLPMNGATAFAYGGKGYICYGNMEFVTTYDPTTNSVEKLSDELTLGDNRDYPISFVLDGFPYFGLGSSGFITTTYHNDIISFFETYTVTFDGNGNDDGTAPQSIENLNGSIIILPSAGTLTKAGKRMIGWNTSSDGTGTHFNIGDTYPISASTTLYAEWFNEKDYLISEGGEISVSSDDTIYFYDTGGKEGNYYRGIEDKVYVMTFSPKQINQKIKAKFNRFKAYTNIDKLHIYNGNSTSAPLIGTYYGTNDIGTVFATNTNGALTFVFELDSYSWGEEGWEAEITTASAYNVTFDINSIRPVVEEFLISTTNNLLVSHEGSVTIELPAGVHTYSISPISYETYQGTITVSDADITETITLIPTDTFIFNSSASVVVESGMFYDSGGKDGYYSANEQDTVTFYPSQEGNVLQVIFNSFYLNPRANAGMPGNRLKIYDGTSTNSPLIGSYRGDDKIETITATNPEGALTFTFQSNALYTGVGWEASISSLESYNPFSAENLTITATSPVCGSSYGKITVLSKLTDLTAYFNDSWLSEVIEKNVVYEYSGYNAYPGTHTIKLEVLAGHIERNFTVVIPEYEEIKSTAIVQGNTVSFNIEGGEAPYQVQIGNDIYTTETGRLTVNQLKSGSYSAAIIDKNYCTDNTILNFDIERFNVYPNPVENGMLYVTMPNSLEDENCEINILTIEGNTIITKNKIIKNTLTIDVSRLNPNTYILSVNSDNYKNATTFIVK